MKGPAHDWSQNCIIRGAVSRKEIVWVSKLVLEKFIWLENLPLDSAWRVGIIKSSRDTLLSGLILRRHSENEIWVTLARVAIEIQLLFEKENIFGR